MKGSSTIGNPMPTQLILGLNPGVLNVPNLGLANEPKFSFVKRKGDGSETAGEDIAKNKLLDDLASCNSLVAAGKAIEEAMIAKLSVSMMVNPEDINTQKPPKSFGVDSLVAVEVRNWYVARPSSPVPSRILTPVAGYPRN
jgi:hypothetical protein